MDNVQEFEDKLIIEGINSEGYGIMPKMIMQDKRLTIESKAIYAYLVSYAGAGSSAFPGLKRILGDLCISEKRFYKHRKLLIDLGYISVKAYRNEKAVIYKNVYTLHQNPVAVTEDEGVSVKTTDTGVPVKTTVRGTGQNDRDKLILSLNKINTDDDDILINKQNSEKIDLNHMLRDSDELTKLTQQLVESDVDIDQTEKIVNHFYHTNEKIDLNIVKQQLSWMNKKINSDEGISDFKSYFLNGYQKRMKNNDLSVSDYSASEEELPHVPLTNWLKG